MINTMRFIFFVPFMMMLIFISSSCYSEDQSPHITQQKHTTTHPIPENPSPFPKAFLYNEHSLMDSYAYQTTYRVFQWDKIVQQLELISALKSSPLKLATLQNFKNKNKLPDLVADADTNLHNEIADSQGTEQTMGIPLYASATDELPRYYAQDGSLVSYQKKGEKFTNIQLANKKSHWFIPNRYLMPIDKENTLNKAIFIDLTNQNIATLEYLDGNWTIRSMNPVTSGMNKPPYHYPTPTGIFVVQGKKLKMLFTADGSDRVEGFSPYATRFSRGAHVHGIPVDYPAQDPDEYANYLGTVPRSHMCVRTATSHAQFIYDWSDTLSTVVFVFK